MRKRRIFTPGPTPLMPEAQLAMARPIIHHRTGDFRRILLHTQENLRQIFKSSGTVVLLTASGTGAMEAAVSSLLGSDDHALAVVAGKFGERWVELCQRHHIPVTPLVKEYGEAASAEEIARALQSSPDTNALLIQGCETSTATMHDLSAIAAAARRERPDILIIVDAITALGSQPLECEQWDLDVVIGGSQKSFAMTPGLSFLALSERAEQCLNERTPAGYYLDLAKETARQKEGQTAFTPAVSLIEALAAVTDAILEQGLDTVLAEAELMARCSRAGLQALGFQLLSSAPANAATAVFPPEGVEAPWLAGQLEDRFGLKVAGGQGKLKGRIIRVAHLGYFDLLDAFSFLTAVELCLSETGVGTPGAGLTAALEVARESRALAMHR